MRLDVFDNVRERATNGDRSVLTLRLFAYQNARNIIFLLLLKKTVTFRMTPYKKHRELLKLLNSI